MGCSSSKATSTPAAHTPVQTQPVQGQVLLGGSPGKHVSKGHGKGKGKGKGKGSGSKWQIMLDGRFKDYGHEEDMILKRAYLTGQKNAKFHLRGQNYEYNFQKMIQKNKGTNKVRSIRPPCGPKPPSKPLLPTGPMIILTVRAGQPGTIISVADPNNRGQTVEVYVPAHAKVGAKLAVPIPAKGESVQDVQRKQEKHDAEHGTKTGWSTGGKVAAGGAAALGVAAVGVGGVILGDHLAGGDMATSVGEAAVDDAGEWVVDGVGDAVDAVGDWAPGAFESAGDWIEGAAEDVGEWAEGAGEDIVDFAGDAADWLGDAGEDIGDFVMDLF